MDVYSSHTLAFEWLDWQAPCPIWFSTEAKTMWRSKHRPPQRWPELAPLLHDFSWFSGCCVPVPIINLELWIVWMFEVSFSIRMIYWMYHMMWSKEREDDMRSNPQKIQRSRCWVAGVCHHVLPWFATRTAGDDWSHLGVEWSSRGCDAGGCGGRILWMSFVN